MQVIAIDVCLQEGTRLIKAWILLGYLECSQLYTRQCGLLSMYRDEWCYTLMYIHMAMGPIHILKPHKCDMMSTYKFPAVNLGESCMCTVISILEGIYHVLYIILPLSSGSSHIQLNMV